MGNDAAQTISRFRKFNPLNSVEFEEITLGEFKQAVSGLSDTVPGEDMIPSKVYKKLNSIHLPCTMLFNGILSTGFLPGGITDTVVVPLAKPKKDRKIFRKS